MNEFRDCKVCIRLPEKYHTEYVELLRRLAPMLPDIDGIQKPVPNIDIFYLGRLNQNDFSLTSERISKHSQELKEKNLVVGGYQLIDGDQPELSLKIEPWRELGLLRYHLEAEFQREFNPKDWPFRPHLGIAKIRFPSTLKRLQRPNQVRKVLDDVNWGFNVYRLEVWGRRTVPGILPSPLISIRV